MYQCEVCENYPSFRLTVTHGVKSMAFQVFTQFLWMAWIVQLVLKKHKDAKRVAAMLMP